MVLMDFLISVKNAEVRRHRQSISFPEILLSVVDTSEEEFIPVSGREGYTKGTFPVPDFDECKLIAKKFSWPPRDSKTPFSR